MSDLLKDRDLITEVRALVEDVENAGKNMDVYCSLIFQMMMTQSTNN